MKNITAKITERISKGGKPYYIINLFVDGQEIKSDIMCDSMIVQVVELLGGTIVRDKE